MLSRPKGAIDVTEELALVGGLVPGVWVDERGVTVVDVDLHATRHPTGWCRILDSSSRLKRVVAIGSNLDGSKGR